MEFHRCFHIEDQPFPADHNCANEQFKKNMAITTGDIVCWRMLFARAEYG